METIFGVMDRTNIGPPHPDHRYGKSSVPKPDYILQQKPQIVRKYMGMADRIKILNKVKNIAHLCCFVGAPTTQSGGFQQYQ